MNRAERDFLREATLACGGLLVLVAGVVLLLDGVELGRRVLSEGDLRGWLDLLLARLPGRLWAACPVAVALAVGAVTRRWQRDGRLVALALVGRSPARIAVVAAVSGLLVASASLGLRELTAPLTARVLGAEGRFVKLAGPVPSEVGDAVVVARAAHLGTDRVEQAEVVWLTDGRIVGRGGARSGRFDGGWELEGGWGTLWDRHGRPHPVEPLLPDPAAWRAHAVGPGPEAPLAVLAASPDPSGRAWLGERLATPLLSALLAALAPALALTHARYGMLGVAGAAVLARTAQGGLVAAAARGAWPSALAVLLPLVVLGVAALVVLLVVHRRGWRG